MVNGEPLDLKKDYVVILNNFSKIGKDGYACLLDPRVKHLTDHQYSARTMKTIMTAALSQFALSQAGCESEQIKKRLKLLNADQEQRCEQGFIKLRPVLRSGIIDVGR